MPSASWRVARADPLELLVAQRDRRQGAGRVAGVDAGLLDVLHDPAEVHVGAVVERVHVDLDGVVEEAVDQDRVLGRGDRGPGDVTGEGLVVVDDLHAASAEDVRRPDEDGVPDLTGHLDRLSGAVGRAVPGRVQPCLVQDPAERAAVLGQVDGIRRGADDRDTLCLLKRFRESERGLAAELDDDAGDRADLLLRVVDLQDVLERERLEVEPRARVVVGGDGLGVAVDHHRVVAGVAQREGRVHAGVVELDALADPVGTAAEDEHRGPLPRLHLGLLVVGAVVVRRLGRELGRAGVHRLVDRAHPEGVANPADDRLRHTA